MSKNWFSFGAANNGVGRLSILSDIGEGGVTAERFKNELAFLGSVKELHVTISSNGGDVSTGFAIYNMLKRHSAKVIVTIDGLAASMASVIAMAGDEILIPDDSMLMIHEPWGSVTGRTDQIISFGDALDKMRDQIANSYAKRSKLSMETILTLMARETWFNAEQAVAAGLADRVIDSSIMDEVDVVTSDISKFGKVPAAFGKSKRFATRSRGSLRGLPMDEMMKRAFARFNNPPGRKA